MNAILNQQFFRRIEKRIEIIVSGFDVGDVGQGFLAENSVRLTKGLQHLRFFRISQFVAEGGDVIDAFRLNLACSLSSPPPP